MSNTSSPEQVFMISMASYPDKPGHQACVHQCTATWEIALIKKVSRLSCSVHSTEHSSHTYC